MVTNESVTSSMVFPMWSICANSRPEDTNLFLLSVDCLLHISPEWNLFCFILIPRPPATLLFWPGICRSWIIRLFLISVEEEVLGRPGSQMLGQMTAFPLTIPSTNSSTSTLSSNNCSLNPLCPSSKALSKLSCLSRTQKMQWLHIPSSASSTSLGTETVSRIH